MCRIERLRLPWWLGLGALGWALGLQAAETRLTLDPRSEGRIFEGIGALSAGASSRLLVDYPEPQRSQVLDLLFKPKFGASLPHLKVEIGGDVNSTDGTEPSHARTRAEFESPKRDYYERGYEWWLMREARRRNPSVYLDALQWGAPGWIGANLDGPDAPAEMEVERRNARKFYSHDNAEFIVAFLRGAQRYHGVTLDYCGIWNETPHDPGWIKLLRRSLDQAGLERVKIVAADRNDSEKWQIASEMLADPELMNAVGVIGAHYVAGQSSLDARRTGKPLWCSEDGFWYKTLDPWPAAAHLARLYNHNYLEGRMTKTVVWSLVSSYYDTLPLPGSGLLEAVQPWSGHYRVHPSLWITAHTTQFAQPGWRYLDSGCKFLAGGGSAVAFHQANPRAHYSIVAETIDAQAPQEITVDLPHGRIPKRFHVWRSQPGSCFEPQPDIRLTNRAFSFTLAPGSVYSLTTTTGQRKGQFGPVPPPSDFPLPYLDTFESRRVGRYARYFSDQGGVFEVAKNPGGLGQGLRQGIAWTNIDWHYHWTPEPYTLIGSPRWQNYEVSTRVWLDAPGSASLWGRVIASIHTADPAKGCWLRIHTDGRWELKAFQRTLAAGAHPFAPARWHTLRLRLAGKCITAIVDGDEVVSLGYGMYRRGQAGLGTGWNHAVFDDFRVEPIEGPTLPDPVNLARAARATASSQWNDEHRAEQINDGKDQTRWNAAEGQLDQPWVALDFGRKVRFDTVRVRQSGTRIRDYRIEYLVEADWRVAVARARAGEAEWEDCFPAVTSSQLRFVVTKVNGDHPAHSTPSIEELEVYDSSE